VFERLAGGLAPTLLFSFASHIAVAAVGMLAIPTYLRLMGEEAYGLVGFYLVLQTWMLLMDLGMSPTVARQLSRFRAGALKAEDAVSLLRTAEAVFVIGGLVAIAVCLVSTGWLAHHWLGRSRLPTAEVDLALRMAGFLLVFRWLANLYQVALVGLERQIAVNIVAVGAAVVRNAGAVGALALVSNSPSVFFGVWAGVTGLEAAATRLLLWRAMPKLRGQWRPGWRLLSKEFGLAAGLTLSGTIATMIAQADKMTLSHSIALGEFGLFSLVISLCSGIGLVVPPMVQSFQPRFTTLLAQGRRAEFVAVYRLSIALVIVVSAGLAGTIAAQPEMVLYAWTGNHQIAHHLAPTLTLYALGSGIASFLFLPYILQFSQGFIRLHVVGHVVFGAIWIPSAVWASYEFGTIGAAVVWCLGNVLFLLLWVPVIHRRLLTPEERSGLGLDTGIRVGLLGALLAATMVIDVGGFSQIESFCLLAAISSTIMALATLTSRELRVYISGMIGYSGAYSR
jgi:O-antigen/teichoic acid export membrane protein